MLRIFGISGLRGVVGTELTPESVSRIAAVFGRFVGQGTVCIGRDTQPPWAMFLSAAAAGLLSTGADVEDLGICPTPTVLLRVRLGRLAGGIGVTASHNPSQWNGMKFAGQDAMFLVPEELARFRQMVETDDSAGAEWSGTGRLTTYPGAVDDHVAAIAESDLFSDIPSRLARRRLRVGIDAANGAASGAAARLVSRLGPNPYSLTARPITESSARAFLADLNPPPATRSTCAGWCGNRSSIWELHSTRMVTAPALSMRPGLRWAREPQSVSPAGTYCPVESNAGNLWS
jgi:phosphomannomutase